MTTRMNSTAKKATIFLHLALICLWILRDYVCLNRKKIVFFTLINRLRLFYLTVSKYDNTFITLTCTGFYDSLLHL